MAQLYDSDPEREVICRICAQAGVDKRWPAKKLIGHIGGSHSKTGWTKKKYVDEFAPDGITDFCHPMKSPEMAQANSMKFYELNQRRRDKVDDGESLDLLLEVNYGLLTAEEQAFYNQYCESVFQQTDRDEVQRPQITSLAFDTILLSRLRAKQLKATSLKGSLEGGKAIEDAVKAAEDRIRKQMDALGISREAQLQRGKVLKSTPASLISAYVDEIERMSLEMLDALELEEKRVYAKMIPRLEKYILREAPDLQIEENDDDGSRGDVPITLDDALRRAGLAVAADSGNELADQDQSSL